MNLKWHVGIDALHEIEKIQKEFSQRSIETDKQKQVKILNNNIQLQIKDFENYLKQIKENNSLSSQIRPKKSDSNNDLEEQLIQTQSIDANQIFEQTEFVNERGKNIEELTKAIEYIKSGVVLSNQLVK